MVILPAFIFIILCLTGIYPSFARGRMRDGEKAMCKVA